MRTFHGWTRECLHDWWGYICVATPSATMICLVSPALHCVCVCDCPLFQPPRTVLPPSCALIAAAASCHMKVVCAL